MYRKGEIYLKSLSCSLRTVLDIRLENLCDFEEPLEISVREFSDIIVNGSNQQANDMFNELKSKLYASFDIPSQLNDPLLIYTLRLFAKETSYKIGFHQELQGLFGSVSTVSIEKIFQMCRKFYEVCPQEALNYLFENENMSSSEIWKSEFEPFTLDFIVCKKSKFEKLEDFAIHTANEEDLFNDFTNLNIIEKPSISGISIKFNRNWFDENFRAHESQLTGLSTDDFYKTIINLLETKNNNAELQNDLVDMLGFESLDLIETLLCNRDRILKDTKSELNNLAHEKNKQKIGNNKNSAGPSYTKQVVVQSEQEKYLNKQFRKMEKKFEKYANASEEFYEETERLNDTINAAKIKPILNRKFEQPEKLPFVFNEETLDVMTKALLGNKLLVIPANAVRKETDKYGEVTIPAAKRAKLLSSNKKFPIKELDEIGQMIFKEIETLNHIQTVVFDTAYQTNENMLVCAPTGAGKTNIALLTITHQIKNHIENGIVHRDQFKIVYICPMKALAAEMVRNFSKKLACLGIIVKELTGDMQLTRKEITETQMLITTPEKWDVITRKGTSENELTRLVKLIIFDEVHLLNTERGPVIEALVARTLRQVISSQRMIRLVGLSATLPNYLDVAHFLRVNPQIGLFFFDSRFRSVPLEQTFIGVKSVKTMDQLVDMDDICYTKVLEFLRSGHQTMVFVHARNMTVRTGLNIQRKASLAGCLDLFLPTDKAVHHLFLRELKNIKSKIFCDLLQSGIGVHHAGMLRSDRNFVEKSFLNGSIRLIICTATLAWGINLPAHGVIIKGTQIYSAQKSCFVDLDVLDVLQIFGRAGRPQFDVSGHGIIITSYDKVHHYLSLLTNQCPIESKFLEYLSDNLNAEIVLGTVTNLVEAVEWLTFTYMYRRIRLNPLVYGISHVELLEDPTLRAKCLHFIKIAAQQLDKAHMIRFSERNGDLSSTHIGRIASHYYIKYDTIEIVNEHMQNFMTEAELINMMALAQEFQQIQVRNEELDELDSATEMYCYLPVPGGSENIHGKVNILMQTYLSRGSLSGMSLVSDMEYIAQNVVRIIRALFEVALHKGLPTLAGRCLMMAKMFEIRMWDFQTPMRQFGMLSNVVLEKIENKRLKIDELREYDPRSLTQLINDHRYGSKIVQFAQYIPALDIDTSIQPITRGILRIRVTLQPRFTWNDTYHGKASESFWIWVEDPENDTVYHWECFSMSKTNVMSRNPIELVFTVALYEDHPPQYLLRIISDRWLGADFCHAMSFQDVNLPSNYAPHTDLLELQPLQTTVLQNPTYEALYTFSHFNPIQTQIFHPLYHTDCNVLLGAPTGSGKTIAAELCMFRLLNTEPERKIVYIAPMKALVRERVEDWKERFEKRLRRTVVEVTGDVTPSFDKLAAASIIITTPEKWDGISRSWQTRNYVKQVGLIIIDEIHLLGQDRGAVLEVIISRTNFISSNTNKSLRIIGLSTAMANAGDLATWLGIEPMGLFNFRPTVRPVPLEVHISGFPGKHYCPRMVSMNKPTFRAIKQYAPTSPSLVFVSSRRQTRMTAMDLIAYIAVDAEPKQWLHEDPDIIESIISSVTDATLKHSLSFGIGIHHGGLQEKDRKVVEHMFLNHKIQILIATATLAWGVNFPAHLVVIKGTEFFDSKVKRYVDMPITDVLQMMGRAGRPQFDDSGVACVFVHDVKKNFYKKFLYEPFPVESNLLPALPDHINAEIVAGNVTSKKKLMEYITWTYFFRRLLENPSYYKLPNVDPSEVSNYLADLSDSVIERLVEAGCVSVNMDDDTYDSTFLGQISSFYYLSHITVNHFSKTLSMNADLVELLTVMCDSEEYATFSVRHNEDKINFEFNKSVRFPVRVDNFESPHVKANLLLQAHFSHMHMPNPEYYVDLRSVMDQSLRILQAMIDISANNGWLSCVLNTQLLIQLIVQGQWHDADPLRQVPGLESEADVLQLAKASGEIPELGSVPLYILPGLIHASRYAENHLKAVLNGITGNPKQTDKMLKHIRSLPLITVQLLFSGDDQQFLLEPAKKPVVTIKCGRSYNVEAKMSRAGSEHLSVVCPRFSKNKEESWFLVLGDERDELLALKRVSIKNHRKNQFNLSFVAPQNVGNYVLTFYLISDSYLGLDQQYDILCKIIPDRNPEGGDS